MAKQEVNKKEEGKLNTMSAMFMEDQGAGQENMTSQDMTIPRLNILQALSPQCTRGDAAYIKEAAAGHFLDNVMSRVYDGEKGLTVVPISYRRAYLEWRPRKLGGGFIKDHGSDDRILQMCTRNEEDGSDMLPNGNQIVTVGEYFCFFLDPETGHPHQCVISMSKTQFKKAKLWNAMINNLLIPKPDGSGNFNPAMFYMAYKISTVPESNDKGNWFGWKVVNDKPTVELEDGEKLYMACREFRKLIAAGQVKVAEPMDDVPVPRANQNNEEDF